MCDELAPDIVGAGRVGADEGPAVHVGGRQHGERGDGEKQRANG